MDTAFPFGFPFATAAYLTLYVLTLVIHVIFMNYVLAGSAVLAVAGLYRWSVHAQSPSPLRELLRDWLPFFLGVAITAGVAPLLFVQILYQKEFYTANLLLEHRWMAILPVLIVAFYLLYLLKSKAVTAWKPGWRALVGAIAMLCFWFVAYSWTENHMLSLHEHQWVEFYGAGRTFYWDPQMVPRLSGWVFGAFPTMALILAWQLRYRGRAFAAAVAAGGFSGEAGGGAVGKPFASGVQAMPGTWHPAAIEPAIRTLAVVALAGMVLAGAGAGWYYSLGTAAMHRAVWGPLTQPYLIAAAVGAGVQAIGWGLAFRSQRLSAAWLTVQSIGLVMTLTGMTVAREAVRLSEIAIGDLYAQHAKAAQVGGLPVFLIFFALNAALIVYCIRLVQPATKQPA